MADVLQVGARYALVFLAILWSAAAAGNSEVGVYRPELQERLNVRVVELDKEIGESTSWAAISGEYLIDSSGYVSIPIAGRVLAAGRPLNEIEDAVAEAVQFHAGLASPPSVSIEMAEHRPVYVLGHVGAPGVYPYQPGMTVIQAFALAGGERRVVDQLGPHEMQELVRNVASHKQTQLELARLRARAARLEAELAGDEDVDFPALAHPTGRSGDESLMLEELRLFSARAEALARDEAAYDDLYSLLQAEIAALDEKLASQRRQIQMVRKTAEDIESLAGRGLAPAQRLLDIQRMRAEIEGKLVDLETAKFRARQDLSKAARDLTDRQAVREIQDERELQETRATIEQLAERQWMLRQLILGTGADSANAGMEEEPVLVFSVIRRRDEGMETIPADEATLLRPGDVLTVRMLLSETPRASATGNVVPVRRPQHRPGAVSREEPAS